MKAIVKSKAEEGLWLEDVAEPEISINDVLIRVLKTGICGTDVHIWNWDEWAKSTIKVPTILGHEIVGEIVEIGENVNDFEKGDIVSVEGHLVCGRCRNCLAGRRLKCANTLGVGVNTDGGFAEYMSVPMTNIWKHEADIDLEVAAIFDPFGNAVHTALAFEVFGEDVLITGAGPIGIMSAAVAKHAGARNVVITDVNAYRLELAARVAPGAPAPDAATARVAPSYVATLGDGPIDFFNPRQLVEMPVAADTNILVAVNEHELAVSNNAIVAERTSFNAEAASFVPKMPEFIAASYQAPETIFQRARYVVEPAGPSVTEILSDRGEEPGASPANHEEPAAPPAPVFA